MPFVASLAKFTIKTSHIYIYISITLFLLIIFHIEGFPLFTIFTMNSTHSFVEASKDMESGIFHVDHKKAEKKIIVRYKECLKNHAAAIGGNATDGCGEFMASGEDGTLEALKCSACNCHRHFHRKEIESDQYCNNSPSSQHYALPLIPDHIAPILARLSPNKSGSTSPSDQSDGKNSEDHGIIKGLENPTEKVMKKRSRTKFTQEQKEKMLAFAQKAGWRIQKLEESVVQKFCQEIGIKRKVLKVWMHNNKNTFAKRNLFTS